MTTMMTKVRFADCVCGGVVHAIHLVVLTSCPPLALQPSLRQLTGVPVATRSTQAVQKRTTQRRSGLVRHNLGLAAPLIGLRNHLWLWRRCLTSTARRKVSLEAVQ